MSRAQQKLEQSGGYQPQPLKYGPSSTEARAVWRLPTTASKTNRNEIIALHTGKTSGLLPIYLEAQKTFFYSAISGLCQLWTNESIENRSPLGNQVVMLPEYLVLLCNRQKGLKIKFTIITNANNSNFKKKIIFTFVNALFLYWFTP